MQYVASTHAASSSIGALRADVVTPGIDNLVINKGSRIEIYALDPSGLRLLHQVPLNGIAIACERLKLPGRDRSSLLVLTSSNRLFALAFAEDRGIYTEASVSVVEHAARPADLCQTIVVDSQNSLIGVHAYNGLFKVIPLIKEVKKRKGRKSISQSQDDATSEVEYELDLERAYNIRLPEHNVHSVCIFNPPASPPCLVILHDDYRGEKILKVRPIILAEKDFADADTTLSFALDDYGSELLVPLAGKGVVVIGEAKAVFIALNSNLVIESKGKRRSSTSSSSASRKRTVECALPLGAYSTWAPIDGSENNFLVGDLYGDLHMLELMQSEDGKISGLSAESIGPTTSATALVYLANRFLYVASHYGDSQLLRLPKALIDSVDSAEDTEMDVDEAEQNGIQIVDTYTNLAPIVDFCVVDSDFGQSQVVTCSGGYKDGSLRIVSHGVGLTELANLEMANAQRLWALRLADGEGRHDSLLISFVNETRLIKFGETDEEGIEEVTDFERLIYDQPTLDAFQFSGGTYQVTKDGVFEVSGTTKWQPAGAKLTVATHDSRFALVGLSDGTLALLDVSESDIHTVATTKLAAEAACLALHTIQGRMIALVGLWSSHALVVFDAATLTTLHSVDVSSSTLLRSVLPISYEDGSTVVYIGLGDGVLISIPLEFSGENSVLLREEAKKSITLGSRPITLASFISKLEGDADTSQDQQNLFVSSDQPTVISRNKGRLNYASMNMRNISAATSFNSVAYSDALVFATPDGLRIGRIDKVQSLHVRTILLGGDQPRRIAHSPLLHAYGILCVKEVVDQSSGSIIKTGSFKIVDDADFDILLDYTFDDDEQGLSVQAIEMDSQWCFAVGSAIVLPTEHQAKRGMLRTFAAPEGTRIFSEQASIDCKGAPYAITQLPGGLMAATVNAQVWAFAREQAQLLELASWGGTFLATSLTAKGNLLLVGDALRSVTLLRFEKESQSNGMPALWEEAREFTANGVMALDLLSEDSCIAADMDMNLFTMRRSEGQGSSGVAQPNGKKGQTLQQAGLFHSGEVITRIKPGSLVPKFAQSSVSSGHQLLYATSNGTIGVVIELERDAGQSLYELQRNVRRVVSGVGSLEHAEWRQFKADYRTSDSVGFIDGTFVERWADLSPTEKAAVMEGGSEAEKILLSQEDISGLVEACELFH